MQASDRVSERQPTGWTYFAGCVLFIVGSLDALWGLAAILNDDIVIVGGHGAILADLTTWGWVHLILGSIMALTGLGLFAGSSGARWAPVFFGVGGVRRGRFTPTSRPSTGFRFVPPRCRAAASSSPRSPRR